MKQFEYTARRPDGTLTRGTLEAPSRPEAIAQLTASHLTPVGLRETTGQPLKKHSATFSPRKLIPGVLGILLSIAGVWIWQHRNATETPKTTDRTKRPPSTVQSPAPASQSEPQTTNGKRPSAQTQGKVATANPIRTIIPRPENRNVPRPKALEELTPPPKQKPAFKRGAEQLLAMVTPSSPGAEVPPLPGLTDEGIAQDLKKAMQENIIVETNDSDKVVTMKEKVADLKEEFRSLSEQEGWTFTEYLNALREQHNGDAKFLRDAHAEIDALWGDRTVSDEDYLKRLKELNAELKERGLPELE